MAAPFADLPRVPGLRRSAPVTTTEVVAGVGVLALAVSFVLSPEHVADGPVICPFRRITGLPCPGCGLTRSWVYLTHGWWREAFLANPFGIVAVLAVLALAGAVIVARVRHTSAPDLDRLVRRPWVAAVVGAWLLFAVVRVAVDLVS